MDGTCITNKFGFYCSSKLLLLLVGTPCCNTTEHTSVYEKKILRGSMIVFHLVMYIRVLSVYLIFDERKAGGCVLLFFELCMYNNRTDTFFKTSQRESEELENYGKKNLCLQFLLFNQVTVCASFV